MADLPERQIERYLEGQLSPAEARELAQSALDRPELFDELTFQAVTKAALVDPAVKEKLDNLAAGDDALKLYVSGELSPQAQRELAQEALENEELFDALAAHGAMEQSLKEPAVRSALSPASERRAKLLPFPRKTRAIAIGSIAAVLALLAVYSIKTQFWVESKSVATIQPPAAPPVRALTPGLDLTTERPVLLAKDLTPHPDGSGATPVFRSATPDSRAPQPSGSIVSVDGLVATVNLGSLDGLAKDVELEVFRGPGSRQTIGRLVVTTVFRERARARIISGEGLRENDQVRAGAPVYLGAVLQQIEALVDQNDVAKASDAARGALAWADSNAGASGEKRRIVERLAALDYRAGDTAAAEEHYRSAIASFGAPPAADASEQAATLNNLAVLYLLSGDTTQAEARFSEAREQTAAGAADGQNLNNLGVLAELRGDARKAETLYSDALRAFQNAPGTSARDRQVVEANLARLRKSAGATH
ncbi:MAG: tetratricopeptide repeat protein [Acidobacteriia bacterium]|nr:tetratricopeptide repeat protein [Terriglobia bacterium]